MNAGTVVFLVTVLLVIGVVAVLVVRRPRRGSPGVELEPPKAPPARPVSPPPPDVLAPPEPEVIAPPEPEVVAPVKPSFRDRLAKARSAFAGAVGSVLSRSKIDDDTWDDLEEALLRA